MPGFRNSSTMATCTRCKQLVLTGYEGGSPFTIDLVRLDPTQEVLAYAARVTTYALQHASNPSHMRVKYRIPKYIGNPPPAGYTIHRAHPCSARATPLVEPPPPVQTRTRPGEYSPITGLPTNGMLPFIPTDGIEPPFLTGSHGMRAPWLKDRFWGNVKVGDRHVCWPWIGPIDKAHHGYARTVCYGEVITKHRRAVHRIAYDIANGGFDEDLDIGHVCHDRDMLCKGGPTCMHRRCCNPFHLVAMTHQENIAAGLTGLRTSERNRKRWDDYRAQRDPGATVITGGAMEMPIAKCEACGLDVTPGTGSSLYIPGKEMWGCHDYEYCPAAPPPWEMGSAPGLIHMPEDDYDDDYEFGCGAGRRRDVRQSLADLLRGERRVVHGGTFPDQEFDARPGQGRRYKRTVTVGTGIDEWEDAVHV